jgi:hypothetical protein
MEWQPITEAKIWDLINKGCLRMSPVQERLWEAIKIMPEKWGHSEYGNGSGEFRVVAVIGRRVIWYDDIEEGFGFSSYVGYGVIGESGCGELELEWAVQRIINLIGD